MWQRCRIMGISDKGSGRDGIVRALQNRFGTIDMAATKRQEDGNGGSIYMRRRRM